MFPQGEGVQVQRKVQNTARAAEMNVTIVYVTSLYLVLNGCLYSCTHSSPGTLSHLSIWGLPEIIVRQLNNSHYLFRIKWHNVQYFHRHHGLNSYFWLLAEEVTKIHVLIMRNPQILILTTSITQFQLINEHAVRSSLRRNPRQYYVRHLAHG